ncbi:hypothetical protein [Pantoea phage Nafs113]|nr:hypothetical protein [Pantoea phage Nafs113]
MSKLNDLTFGLFGEGALGWQGKRGPGSVTPPPTPAPVFTTQPGTNATTGTAGGVTSTAVLYQQGGLLRIEGAVATNATAYEWQQFVNGAWAASGNTAAVLNLPNATAAMAGRWRLKATGAGGDAISNEVIVENAFIYLQHLTNDQQPDRPIINVNDRTQWTMAATANKVVPVIALIRKLSAPTVNYMGIDSGLTATSSDETKVTVATSGRNVTITPKAVAGNADLYVNFAALSAHIAITITV